MVVFVRSAQPPTTIRLPCDPNINPNALLKFPDTWSNVKPPSDSVASESNPSDPNQMRQVKLCDGESEDH
jgi:hypothetical protein